MVVMVRALTFLLISVSCTLGEENITSFCSVEQVVNCTEGLDTLGKEIAPLYNINELDLLCRKWQKVRPCLDDVAMTCATEKINGTEARKTFEGIVARKRAEQAASEWIKGYDYLCYEGKAGYPVVRECMSGSRNLTLLTEECYKTYENRTWWLDPDEPVNTHRFCKAAKIFFDCLKKFGNEECGKEFTDWIWDYQEELWSSHLHHIECLVGNEFSAGEIFIVSICGAATVVCIVLSILSFVYKPESKIEDKKRITKKRATIAAGESNLSFLEEIGECSTDPLKSTPVRRVTKSRKRSVELSEL
ncbi:hypothetical protein LSH36_208g04077 [Paralvinella palmiformis]|uniref:Uncharacterized protein n=1 Tax=Paralvinella palmiformis TaxID=53620 RepID=A0AAD9N5Y1_9ANNE|nr:hypothetical protein LSH36_208g04077 [Paralvinella palmiformis]